ncbi:hypothetical protein GcM3_219043 [Golovinomyces cichoracearum]|uniref:Uncharacterized protein n=1 Tax=Golovinomyces cichoracearum TaxID=62708 RepID=A0A420H7F0_9PEZI|nr:hypothetical protein GcM3_219043 [Golovinomyces cichoracearum]
MPTYDRDGDTVITDISTLKGQVASLLAAFMGNEEKILNKNNDRTSDEPPFPPKLSQS